MDHFRKAEKAVKVVFGLKWLYSNPTVLIANRSGIFEYFILLNM